MGHKYISKKIGTGGKWEYVYADGTSGATSHKKEEPEGGSARFKAPEIVSTTTTQGKYGEGTTEVLKTASGHTLSRFTYNGGHSGPYDKASNWARSNYSVADKNGEMVTVDTVLQQKFVAAIMDRVKGDATKFKKAFKSKITHSGQTPTLGNMKYLFGDEQL